MLIREDMGQPLTFQQISPGDTPTGIGSEIYKYVERTIAYTSGGTYQIVAEDTIVGASGAARAIVKSVTLDSGTWAGGDAAGTLTIHSQVGAFQSENLSVEGNANAATVAADSTIKTGEYPNKNKHAKTALISVQDQTILLEFVAKPGQTTFVGHPVVANGSYEFNGLEMIQAVKFIDRVSGSTAKVGVTCFF